MKKKRLAQVYHCHNSKELNKYDLGFNQIDDVPMKSELSAHFNGKELKLFEKVRNHFGNILEQQKKYVRISDKFIIVFLQLIYLATRMVLLPLGHKKRNEFFFKHHFSFKTLLQKLFPNRLFLIHMSGTNCKAFVKTGSSYEDEIITELFTPQENEVVVDVGAHVGKYTLKAGNLIGSKGKIISLEPNPETYKILVKNIKLNKINAISLQLAVSNKKGKVKFYLADYRGKDSIIKDGSELGNLEVETDTLDNILHSLGLQKVDWIKIDVQGAEVWVLEGVQDTIKNSENLRLVVEIHEEKYGKPIKEMLKRLNFNYKIYPRPNHPTNYHLIASKKLQKQ